ncbi:DHA2 family multidrug resistance protein-like MFS transporter [Curtobacterium sp. PhB172]|uniref:MFS transporter n=1 Tax=Curtobacterium sp. PhB172 TaxID=2485196 RepID=UPI000FB83ADC|nr:MFS transporter [Curtobacterium sp. PhB172]ROS70230.1 DHA2 family multidrug resistance protein-like MFS transporter [Curtobacterium sp. PhB172]
MTETTPSTSTAPIHRASVREWASLGVLTLAVVLLAIDGTVLALAVPSLTADLDPTATQVLWIGDVYSFALAGLLVTMGNVADRIGRKRLLLIGAVAFGLASAAAAFAQTPELLIAARALLGIAGATLMPSTLSLVRTIFRDARQRTTAIAVWSAGATGGAAAGPLVGGALLEHFWWGSVFLINIPVIVVIVIAGAILLPESKGGARTPIDLLSAVLSVLAIVPLVYAVKHVAGHGFDWTVPLTALLGIGAGWWFVRRQKRLATPLIDLQLFRIPAFSGAVVANSLSVFALSGLLFFFSQYLQLVRGFTPLLAGAAELPATLASIAVIAIIGLLSRRVGPGRSIGLGLAVAAVGMAGLAFAEGLPTYWGIAISLAVVGLGVGVSMTLATDAVVAAAPRERAGAASAISETGYELGVALGIAVLGSLQTAFYRSNLDVTSGAVSGGVGDRIRESLASASQVLQDGDPILEHARHAFTGGMQLASICAAVALAVAAAVALRVIPNRQDGPHEH